MAREIETGAQRSDQPAEPSDAVLTVPNVLTFARLALIPLFLWLALGPRNDLWAWIVGFVLGSSDYFDGIVARRYGQVSKLGILLDPLSDRLALGAAAAVLLLRDFAPLWAVLLVVGRDGATLLAGVAVKARGMSIPPVTFLGKAGSFGLMWAFGTFVAASIPEPPWPWVRLAAWVMYWPGLAFAYAASAGYARAVARSLRTTPATG